MTITWYSFMALHLFETTIWYSTVALLIFPEWVFIPPYCYYSPKGTITNTRGVSTHSGKLKGVYSADLSDLFAATLITKFLAA